MSSIYAEIPDLDTKELRKFGLLLASFIVIVFGLLLSIITGNVLIWPWVLSAGLVSWSLLHAKSLNVLYKIWMILAVSIGHFISTITLVMIFFFLVMPIGLALKFTQGSRSQSGWIESESQYESDYENPY